jgi:hypothetical protein
MVKCGAALISFLVWVVPTVPAQKNTAPWNTPECRPGAICFSGEVTRGQEFHKDLNEGLEFSLEGEWGIDVVPKHPTKDCDEFTSAVNAPYRAHNQLEIDRSYGWTAEDETSDSPREFDFVTNCADQKVEMERLTIVLWPHGLTEKEEQQASAKLGSSPLGKGRLWITDFRISHARDTADDKRGTIEWMRFTVEIVLPTQKPKQSSAIAH